MTFRELPTRISPENYEPTIYNEWEKRNFSMPTNIQTSHPTPL